MLKIHFDGDLSVLPKCRRDAFAVDSKYYFTGVPCKHGHLTARHTETGHCVDCYRTWKVDEPRKKLNKRLSSVAMNAHQPWSEAHINYAIEKDQWGRYVRSAVQCAIQLGRSQQSVAHIRRTHKACQISSTTIGESSRSGGVVKMQDYIDRSDRSKSDGVVPETASLERLCRDFLVGAFSLESQGDGYVGSFAFFEYESNCNIYQRGDVLTGSDTWAWIGAVYSEELGFFCIEQRNQMLRGIAIKAAMEILDRGEWEVAEGEELEVVYD